MTDESVDTTPIYSELPLLNENVRMIVFRFIDRLKVLINEMETAVADDNYTELAKLAHTLKGLGGTVGFVVFTEPATELEISAKKMDRVAAVQSVEAIRVFAKRVAIADKNTPAIA